MCCVAVLLCRESSSFFEDPGLEPRFRAKLDDYMGSGYDRGHMVSAAVSARFCGGVCQLCVMFGQGAPVNIRQGSYTHGTEMEAVGKRVVGSSTVGNALLSSVWSTKHKDMLPVCPSTARHMLLASTAAGTCGQPQTQSKGDGRHLLPQQHQPTGKAYHHHHHHHHYSGLRCWPSTLRSAVAVTATAATAKP